MFPVFQNLNYKLQSRLSDVLPNQQSHQKYVHRWTCACCGTLSGFPLQYRLFVALSFERGAGARLSRYDQAHRLTVKRRVAWTAISCHLLRVSPVLRRTGRTPPRTSTLKPIFHRNRYKKYVLSRAGNEAVSDITL